MCISVFFASLFLFRVDVPSSSFTSNQLSIPPVTAEIQYQLKLSAASDQMNSLIDKNKAKYAETFVRAPKVINSDNMVTMPVILKDEQEDGASSQAASSSESNKYPALPAVMPVGAVEPVSVSDDSVGRISPSAVIEEMEVPEATDMWLRNRTSLIELLEERSASLRSRYPAGMDFTSTQVRYLATHQRATRQHSPVIPTTPLTNALTESYFGLRSEQFIIGVTGGSSSPGVHSYVALVQDWFSTQLNFSIGIRNGAMGATSQLQTSPCIYQIIGDRTKFEDDSNVTQEIDVDTYLQAAPIDLLLWEFAQNDGRMAFHEVKGEDCRKSSAESYLRGLFSRGSQMPLAVGFVHLWDVSIHSWEFGSDQRVPDLSWMPMNEVRNYYEPYFDCFAVNTIRFILGPTCINQTSNVQYRHPPPNCVTACTNCTKMKSILRDPHHPSVMGYTNTRDILLHTILAQWLEALIYEVKEYRTAKAIKPSLRSLPREAIRMNQADPDKALSMPLLVPNTVIPITRGMRSACRIGGEPLFAPPDPHLHFECDPSVPEDNILPIYAPVEFTGSDHIHPGFLPLCDAVPRVDLYATKWNKHRRDRKMPFVIPNHNCSTAHFGWDRQPPVFNATSLDENGNIIHHPYPPFLRPLVIHLRGMNRLRYALLECSSLNFDCDGLRVKWAGRELKMNVNKTGTVYDSGRFGWIHKFTDEEIEHAKGKPTYFSLSYCPSQEAPRLFLHRHSVWYED